MIFPRRGLPTLAFTLAMTLTLPGCQSNWGSKPSSVMEHLAKIPGPFKSKSHSSHDTQTSLADLQLVEARQAEARGELDRAIQIYQKCDQQPSHHDQAARRLAVIYDRKGEPEKASTYYERILKKHPQDAELLCDLGYHEYLLGRLPEAETHLRNALKINSQVPRANNNLGLVLARTGRRDEALQCFTRAGCSVADAHTNLAFVLMWEHRWNEAAEQVNLALASNPASPNAQQARQQLTALAPASAVQEVAKANASRAPSDAKEDVTTVRYLPTTESKESVVRR